jgi:hypothetical protein
MKRVLFTKKMFGKKRKKLIHKKRDGGRNGEEENYV